MRNDPKMQIFFDEAEVLLKSNRTFKDIFNIQIDTWSKRTLFIYEDESEKTHKITFLEFKEICLKYAGGIKEALKDIPLNSFVALKMKNSPKWIYVFWGLIIAGYCPIFINPITLKDDVNRLIEESGAKAIVLDKDESLSIPVINVDSLLVDKIIEEEVWANHLAFCTSGTTGKSRIFVYNGENIVHQIYAAYCMPETTDTIMYQKPEIRLLCMVPLAHIFGFVADYLWFAFFGRCIVFPNSNEPDELVRVCKKYKVSHIFSVPLFWDRVAKSFEIGLAKESEKKQALVRKLIQYNNKEISKTEAGLAASKLVKSKVQKSVLGDKVVFCIAGGSALSKDTLRTINGIGYPLYNGYGMTEIGITSVELSKDAIQRNKASIGKQLTAVNYKVKDDELLVKSPQIHCKTLINGKLEDSQVDSEGYYHTGDIATIDEDGYVYIKGKKKDVVIGANGENIYPDEIEIKFKDISLIDELSVLGVPSNNGEKLVMVLHVNRQLSKQEIEEVENQIAEANNNLPIAMQVQEFYLSTLPLPINPSMKIMRYQLKDDLLNRPETFIKLGHGELVSFEGFDPKKVEEVSSHLIDIVADVLNIKKEEIAPGAHFILDLGGDSFTYMSIIASVEAEFEIKIPTEMIGRLNTVNEFTSFLLRNK